MNKKIIAAAVASAFVVAVPTAQAEIKVYSQVQFEISDIDFGANATDTTRVTDNQRGRFGIKGGHDLGGGLKSFILAEFDFDGNGRDVNFGGSTERNAFRIREVNAGLKGAFGSIALGTVKSGYKYNGGVKYDPFVATQLEQRGRGGMSSGVTGQNGFLNNALVYKVKAGIAKIHATYSIDDTDRDGDGQGDDGEYSLGVSFGNKKWEAGAAIIDQGLTGNGNNESQKIFGKIKFAGVHTIVAQIENVETSTTEESDYIMIGYHLKIGKGLLVVNVGDRDSNDDTLDADNITVGYIHKFNKKTRLFGGYQTFDQTGDTSADRDTLTVGIRVDI